MCAWQHSATEESQLVDSDSTTWQGTRQSPKCGPQFAGPLAHGAKPRQLHVENKPGKDPLPYISIYFNHSPSIDYTLLTLLYTLYTFTREFLIFPPWSMPELEICSAGIWRSGWWEGSYQVRSGFDRLTICGRNKKPCIKDRRSKRRKGISTSPRHFELNKRHWLVQQSMKEEETAKQVCNFAVMIFWSFLLLIAIADHRMPAFLSPAYFYYNICVSVFLLEPRMRK